MQTWLHPEREGTVTEQGSMHFKHICLSASRQPLGSEPAQFQHQFFLDPKLLSLMVRSSSRCRSGRFSRIEPGPKHALRMSRKFGSKFLQILSLFFGPRTGRAVNTKKTLVEIPIFIVFEAPEPHFSRSPQNKNEGCMHYLRSPGLWRKRGCFCTKLLWAKIVNFFVRQRMQKRRDP